MPKYRSNTRISGKIGDVVYTNGKNGQTVRSSPQLSEEQRDAKRDLPVMQRTKLLNRLASGLHKAAEEYAYLMRSSNFYSRVQKRFQAEKTDEPILLLHALRDLEAHPDYVFTGSFSMPQTEMTVTKTAFNLGLTFTPKKYKMRSCNSMYLEMILFIFSGDDALMRTESLATPWLRTNEGGNKQASMSFKRKAGDRYYLLACRCVLAMNAVERPEYWSDTRMRFIGGDALRAEDKQRIADHPAELQEMRRKKNGEKKVREVKRVEIS